MKARSEKRGVTTSAVEVTNISVNGFWLLVGPEEVFLSFSAFPWFRRATVEQIAAVTLPSQGHLYWPDLDIDLAVESIRDPAAFPLVSGTPERAGNAARS